MATAVVGVSVAPVLAQRSLRSEQVTQAILGAPLRVLEHRTGERWARIRMEDGYEGWIARGALAPPFGEAGEWVTITDLWANLRTLPDYQMPAPVAAPIGATLPLRERRPGWLGVTLPGGTTGWLEEHRARVHAPGAPLPSPTPEALLATARRFLGVPYLWGGCTPWGLDCSGFVQLVYRLHGVALPRDAGPQALVGEPVPIRMEEPGRLIGLAPGDAVFFHAAESRERISHVALALGDGAFIHAAGSDAVRIDPWEASPYAERVAGARRYLGG